MNLNKSIDAATEFINSEFHLSLNKSILNIYSKENWTEFCKLNQFDNSANGIYVPVTFRAYVKNNTSDLISNIFHELYGHGLFCEHSQLGKILTRLTKVTEQNLFMYGKVDTKEQLFGMAEHNIYNYEGFAIWLESLLCAETDNKLIWQSKVNELTKEQRQLYNYFLEQEKNLTRFGLMSQMGFPKYYDDEQILEIVKLFYGKTFNNIDFVLLRGSKKPESDIDLFIVSTNNSKNYFNGWLDIYELNRYDFESWCSKLDISVTDPLIEGKLIYGDENYFNKYKLKIHNQEINGDALKHHINEINRLKEYVAETSHEKESTLKYIWSFSKNLEELSQGNKPLTFKNLKYAHNKA